MDVSRCVVLILVLRASANDPCSVESKSGQYYLVKSCYRMNDNIISWIHTKSYKDCAKIARQKKGFAFNYSPFKSKSRHYGNVNCEILSCPDVMNLTTLVKDEMYDYFSIYGNTQDTINSSCLSQTGLFKVFSESENYTTAINTCNNSGGYLADVLSQLRTVNLARLLLESDIHNWDKLAYVGLNSYPNKTNFETSRGTRMECFMYYAWAPGHPRKNHDGYVCVVLDSNETWRTVTCKTKMPFICEIRPDRPYVKEYGVYKNITCSKLKGKRERKHCRRIKKAYNGAKHYTEPRSKSKRCKKQF